MPAVWRPDALHCFHHAQCQYTAHLGVPRGRMASRPAYPRHEGRPCGMTVMRWPCWQVGELKSGRPGNLPLNRHRTTRSISASNGDKEKRHIPCAPCAGGRSCVRRWRSADLLWPHLPKRSCERSVCRFQQGQIAQNPCQAWPRAVEFHILSFIRPRPRSTRRCCELGTLAMVMIVQPGEAFKASCSKVRK